MRSGRSMSSPTPRGGSTTAAHNRRRRGLPWLIAVVLAGTALVPLAHATSSAQTTTTPPCNAPNPGAALAWGANDAGQLGDGTTTSRPTPAEASGLGLGAAVTQVAAAEAFKPGVGDGLARTADGSVWSWGENNAGQVGDGSTVDRATPVR